MHIARARSPVNPVMQRFLPRLVVGGVRWCSRTASTGRVQGGRHDRRVVDHVQYVARGSNRDDPAAQRQLPAEGNSWVTPGWTERQGPDARGRSTAARAHALACCGSPRPPGRALRASTSARTRSRRCAPESPTRRGCSAISRRAAACTDRVLASGHRPRRRRRLGVDARLLALLRRDRRRRGGQRVVRRRRSSGRR